VLPGQTVTYSGSATDPDEGTLPPADLDWTVLLHHNTHVHTHTEGTGATGSFVVENHGPIGTFSYEILLTATDASGLSRSTSVTVNVGTDSVPPSTPTGLTATASSYDTVGLSWSPSTDNAAVTGYQLQRCTGSGCTAFTTIATPTGTTYSDTGLAGTTSYSYRVIAVDASGNASGASATTTVTTPDAPAVPAGLVAAYNFDAGAGSTVSDASAHGNTGTVIGATWTTGKYGGALSFDGTSSVVRVPDSASLDLTSAMTLSAWVNPTATQSGWRTGMQKETDAWFLNASNDTGALRPSGGATTGGTTRWITGTTPNPVGTWTHLALTYDGTALTLYVNGVQAATTPASGAAATTASPLWIGGNSPYGEYFNGRLDDVRVYNRALTPTEITNDMATPVGGTPPPVDTTPPSTPTGLTATATSSTTATVSWTASTDNVAVTGYTLQRCTGTGCTTFATIASPTTTSYNDTGLTPTTAYSYRVAARDAAGNTSPNSTTATTTTPAGSGIAGLVAAYAFDSGGGSTVTDASGNGNTGTINGATWTTGKYGGALAFNGTTATVRVPDSASLHLSTAMTLSAWVSPTVAQTGWRTVLQKETDAWFLNASNDTGARRPAGGATIGGSIRTTTGSSALPLGTWTHLELTYDGSAISLYVNGVRASTKQASGTIQSTSSPLWIGGNSPYGEYFNGRIDDVRIYNRALSQAEITIAMGSGLP
jgi:hypothetical protein